MANHTRMGGVFVVQPDEMQRLTHDLQIDHVGRMQALNNVHARVVQGLAEFQSGRLALSADQRQRLNKYMDRMHQNASDLCRDVAKFLTDLDTAHQNMAGDQRQWLADHMKQLHHGLETFLQELNTTRQHIATEQSQTLEAYIDELRQNVSNLRRNSVALLRELHTVHQCMARAQHTQLTDYVNELRQNVSDLRQQAQTFVNEVDAAHQNMTREQHQALKTSRANLTSEVLARRSEFQAKQNELRAAQHEAHRAWNSFATIMQRRSRPQINEVEARLPKSIAQQSPVNAAPNEDLTVIRGIGPGMKRHLNAAGIYTLDQLANISPETLRASLGEVGRLAKVEQWIEQAQTHISR
jgi:predicted flap endonuclease-1-like 5' DNA nuclease